MNKYTFTQLLILTLMSLMLSTPAEAQLMKKFKNIKQKAKDKVKGKIATSAGAWYYKQYGSKKEPASIQKISKSYDFSPGTLVSKTGNDDDWTLAASVPEFQEVLNTKFGALPKVYFSTKPFTNPADAKANSEEGPFDATKPLYAIVVLEKTLKEQLELRPFNKGEGILAVDVSQNPMKTGSEYTTVDLKILNKNMDQKYLLVDILPETQKAQTFYEEGSSLADFITRLDKEPTKILYAMKSNAGHKAIVLQIELDLTHADMDKIKKNALATSQFMNNNWSSTRDLPVYFYEKSKEVPGLTNKQLGDLFKKRNSDFVGEVLKVVVKAKDPSWEVETNEFDLPLYQYLRANTMIFYKGVDGECYFKEFVDYNKKYLGGGSYADARAAEHSEGLKVDCDKRNKK